MVKSFGGLFERLKENGRERIVVAGNAEILIVPDIGAGNIFAKGLEYFAHSKMGITIVGTSAPVLIPPGRTRVIPGGSI